MGIPNAKPYTNMFLEISDKVCVNTGEISWVSLAEDGLGSIIYCGDKEYPSDIPYQSLVIMLKQSNGTMDKLDKYLSVATVQTV